MEREAERERRVHHVSQADIQDGSGIPVALARVENSSRDTSTLTAAIASGPPSRRHCGSPCDVDRTARCPSTEASVHNPLPTSDMIPSRRDASLSRSAGRVRRGPRDDAVFAGVAKGTGPIRCWSAIAPLPVRP